MTDAPPTHRRYGLTRAWPDPVPAALSPETAASWVDLCHALLNSNEFVYRN
jgi:hypothetical protein